MVIGSARKVLDTKPPSVAKAQAATKTTKNEMPRTILGPWATGSRGRGMGYRVVLGARRQPRAGDLRTIGVVAGARGAGSSGRRAAPPEDDELLDEPGIDDRLDVRLLLDDADLEQEVRRLVRELLELS